MLNRSIYYLNVDALVTRIRYRQIYQFYMCKLRF